MINCDRDCLNCPYSDVPEECLEAPLTHEEFERLDLIEELLAPKTEEQKKRSAYNRAYRQKHKERLDANRRAYYAANRDRLIAYGRAYREANRERLAARAKAYKAANRERITAYQHEYRNANKVRLAKQKKAYFEANRERLSDHQKWIAVYRKDHGLTQKDLANMIGKSRSTVSEWECSIAPADWDKLCTVLPELEKYRPREETEQCGRY